MEMKNRKEGKEINKYIKNITNKLHIFAVKIIMVVKETRENPLHTCRKKKRKTISKIKMARKIFGSENIQNKYDDE